MKVPFLKGFNKDHFVIVLTKSTDCLFLFEIGVLKARTLEVWSLWQKMQAFLLN